MWGVLVFAGNLVNIRLAELWRPDLDRGQCSGRHRDAGIMASSYALAGARTFDTRMLLSFVLYLAFGFFADWLGHFTPKQAGTFWPIYMMMIYSIAGIWVGRAFTAIGLSVTALTLICYFFAGDAFVLCMAFVNGGGLILGGLWMRRS